jgi:hypothetical protein
MVVCLMIISLFAPSSIQTKNTKYQEITSTQAKKTPQNIAQKAQGAYQQQNHKTTGH